MRYFDQTLVNSNPRTHGEWWSEVCANREWFHRMEEQLAEVQNASPILPREAWQDFDTATRAIMRGDEGAVWMDDLMPLAKSVNIGKLVHMSRVIGDAGTVQRSMSGQVPVPLDKVGYDFQGSVVPIFSSGFGREWREWNTLQSENFDALADDNEAINRKIRRNMALYALDGDANIQFQGYRATGIRTDPRSKSINLGSGAGGANINLVTATADQFEAFVNGPFGAMLDANFIPGGVNLYVSPEIARNLDKPYSGSAGFKGGSLRQYIEANRRINKIAVSFELTGNEFFGFVPSSDYIRPLVGMAVNTTGMTRLNPTDNYQFLVMGAMGIEIRTDINGRGGVFYSVVVN